MCLCLMGLLENQCSATRDTARKKKGDSENMLTKNVCWRFDTLGYGQQVVVQDFDSEHTISVEENYLCSRIC
jgi:hypothetical protein